MSYKIDFLKCVENDWYHKWCPVHDYRLIDYVKGPLKYPMMTIPIPYEIKDKDEMDRCDCARHLKEYYSRSGIPDPWSEYLILRRENDKGRDASSDFPKCDLDITRYLDRNCRVYLGQGIPDPWKKWTYLERLEPCTDDVRQNCKSYLENLRTGPGCDKYDVEKVCCPNCDRQLLVVCLKKSSQGENEVEKPIEEELVEQKIYLKDACVETDHLPDVKNNEVQTVKMCNCKSSKICGCRDNCLTCQVCNKSKNEEGTERRIYKKGDSCCDCKKNCTRNGCFYNAVPYYPMRTTNIRHRIPVQDLGCGPPLHKSDFGRQGTIHPFYCTNSDHCVCSAQRYIGFEDKNNQCLELQLICPKCKRKRGKIRQNKCEQSEEKRFPCHCKNNEITSFKKLTHENECECHVCNRAYKALNCKERIKPKTSCDAEHRCQCYSEYADKTGIFGEKDYVHLLEILGGTALSFIKPDMDCENSKTTGNKNHSKGKRRSLSRPSHSRRTDNTTEVFRRGFHDWDRGGWTDHNYRKYEINRFSTGRRNEFEAVQKDQKCNKRYRNPNYSFDEVRKMRNHFRSQRNRNAFRKELSYFLSNCRKKGVSNDSELSSESRLGRLSGEIQAGK